MKFSDALANELDITFWKLKSSDAGPTMGLQLPEEELSLLKNILKSIHVEYQQSSLRIEDTVPVYTVQGKDLIFNDVARSDSPSQIHLASLLEMVSDQESKKKTWFKLKKWFL